MYIVIFNYTDSCINIENLNNFNLDLNTQSIEEILDKIGYELNNIDWMECDSYMIKNLIKDSIDIL